VKGNVRLSFSFSFPTIAVGRIRISTRLREGEAVLRKFAEMTDALELEQLVTLPKLTDEAALLVM
jgi:hypothetical protein